MDHTKLRDRIQTIFDEAMNVPLEDRATRLDQLCSGDDSLRSKAAEWLLTEESVDRDEFLDDTMTFLGRTPRINDLPADDWEDQQFGHFRLERELARGGMGVVFRARDQRLDRTVALKMVLTGRLASAEEVRRFQTEAQAAAGLDHPNIVPVYEAGEIDGRHYLAMAFVEGTSLQEKVNQGPLPPVDAAELMRDISTAIHYAHSHKIIHRDLKPSNVLIDSSGHPRVTDFGLAKRQETDASLTATGQVMGTPNFMSPEQAAARLDEVGALSDVYSLGAMLYALLTGRPPFQAASVAETLKQLLEIEPVPPRVLNPAIPRDLETICLRCLAKNPDDRFFASAGELADDLGRFLNDEPVRVRRVGAVVRLARWCKKTWKQRRRWVIATAASLLLAAAAIVVGLSLRNAADRKSQLAQTLSTFEAGLKSENWSEQHLQMMEQLVEDLGQFSNDQAKSARERMHKQFGEFIRTAIRQPRMDVETLARIDKWLRLLQSRDGNTASELQKEFDLRQGRTEIVLQLSAPFDKLSQVFPAAAAQVVGQSLQRRQASGKGPLLTSIGCAEHVQSEAVFDAGWDDGRVVGLALNASKSANGYEFLLRAAAAKSPDRDQTFNTIRGRPGHFILELRRNGTLLRSRSLPAESVPRGPLRMTAARDGLRIMATVNNDQQLQFHDIMPISSAQPGKFGIVWDKAAPLRRLYASKRVAPASPSAMEEGDRLYLARDYSAARNFYQQQAVQAAGTPVGFEARAKEALCLLASQQLDEASQIFATVALDPAAANGKARLWRDVAFGQLLLAHIRKKDFAAAETLVDQLSLSSAAGEQGGYSLATVTPQALQNEVLAHFKSTSGGINLWRGDKTRVRKLQLALRVEKLLGIGEQTTMWTELDLIRALRIRGDVDEAYEMASRFLKEMPIETRGFGILIVKEYGWLVRTRNVASAERQPYLLDAMAELDQRLFADPGNADPKMKYRPFMHELLLERARLLIALGRPKNAAADVDAFFAHADEPRKNYRVFSDACLLRAFLHFDEGEDEKARQLLLNAKFPAANYSEKSSAGFAGSIGLMNALIAAGLCKSMSEAEVEQLLMSYARRHFPAFPASQLKRMITAVGVRPALLTEMWGTPRGRLAARQLVMQTVSFRKFIQTPPALFAANVVYTTGVSGKLTKEQHDFIYESFELAAQQVIDGKIKLGLLQIAGIGAVWKGVPTGWLFLRSIFPKALRARASYVLGLRYKRLQQKSQATRFFRDALRDGADNPTLVKLVRAELKN